MNSVSQLRVWKCLADTQKILNQKDDWKKSFDKVTELENQLSMGEVVDDDDEERNTIEDDDDDLIEKELLLSDSGKYIFLCNDSKLRLQPVNVTTVHINVSAPLS